MNESSGEPRRRASTSRRSVSPFFAGKRQVSVAPAVRNRPLPVVSTASVAVTGFPSTATTSGNSPTTTLASPSGFPTGAANARRPARATRRSRRYFHLHGAEIAEMHPLDANFRLAATAHAEREDRRYDRNGASVQPVGDAAAIFTIAQAEGVRTGRSTGV